MATRRLALRVHSNGNRADDLSFHGIRKAEAVWWNLSRSALLEQALRRREAHLAWHALFARNMFLPVTDREALLRHVPGFTVISAPGFHSRPEMDGTRSEVFILIHFGRKEVLIGGSLYAGEIKKSIFTVMNYLLPPAGVLPMHCAASYGRDDQDVACLLYTSDAADDLLCVDL